MTLPVEADAALLSGAAMAQAALKGGKYALSSLQWWPSALSAGCMATCL